MTEKRFKLSYPNGTFLIDGDKPLYHMKNDLMIVELLNELAEENQQLINDCSILVQSNQDYRKENEQLKQFIQELTTKGTGKIHLANGNIYKVNAILTDFKR